METAQEKGAYDTGKQFKGKQMQEHHHQQGENQGECQSHLIVIEIFPILYFLKVFIKKVLVKKRASCYP